jgi:hypothetical protein
MKKPKILLLMSIFLTTHPLPVSAEVMDKMQSLPTLWFWAGVGSFLGGISVFTRWWYGVIILPVVILCAPVGVILELQDSLMRQAILNEVGPSYIINVYLGGVLVFAGYVVGGFLYLQRKKAT